MSDFVCLRFSPTYIECVCTVVHMFVCGGERRCVPTYTCQFVYVSVCIIPSTVTLSAHWM